MAGVSWLSGAGRRRFRLEAPVLAWASARLWGLVSALVSAWIPARAPLTGAPQLPRAEVVRAAEVVA